MIRNKGSGKIFSALADRRAQKSVPDLAHIIVPVVSLAILSAIFGVNASKLPDDNSTRFAIIITIFGLSSFYIIMELLWEAVRQKNIVRILLGAGFAFTYPTWFSFVTPGFKIITQNSALTDGVFYGWAITFICIAFLPNPDPVINAAECSKARND